MSLDQLNIFDLEESNENDEGAIMIQKLDYIGEELITWKDLFLGYNHIHAITYSYGLSFIEEVLESFDTAEIIFGYEKILNNDVHELMAAQKGALKKANDMTDKHKELKQKVKNEDLMFYVVKDFISHEKIYLLSDDEGNTRVIFGSGNFSKRAFNGEQGEVFGVIDNSCEAYESYLNGFNTLKELSCMDISKQSILTNITDEDSLIEEIPIIKEAKIYNRSVVIEENDNKEEIEYYTSLEESKNKYRNIFPKFDKEGHHILLKPKKITKFIKDYKEKEKQKKEKMKHYPQFNIDYDKNSVNLNDEIWDLTTDPASVKSDIENFIEYMKGFDGFIGNTDILKQRYFNVANYMFVSPFISMLRYKAYKVGDTERFFPPFAILCGDSNAGKSSFVQMVNRLMFGKEMPYYHSDDYTKTAVQGLLLEAKGCPILIDDVQRKRFNDNSDEIIKHVDILPKKGNKTHPTIIITSNDIPTLKAEYQKRCILFVFNQKLDQMKSLINKKALTRLLNNMTNSFYKEYLIRMIPKVNQMMERMEKEKNTDSEYPDIFKMSSETIVEIIKEQSIIIPDFVKIVTFNDYCGEVVVSERAIKNITKAWENNQSLFKINRNTNTLKYTAGEKGYEAKWIANELPPVLRADVVGNEVVMDLEAAEKVFGIKFKKSKLKLFGK